MKTTKRGMIGLLGGAAFALTAFTGTASAQDWQPTKPIDLAAAASSPIPSRS